MVVTRPELALAAQLPTGCAPREPRWGTSPTEVLEAQGTYGTPSAVTRSLKWYRALSRPTHQASPGTALPRAIRHVLRHVTCLAVLLIPPPLLGQGQTEVEQGMVVARDVPHVHAHLAVVDLAPVATPLALHTHRVRATLGEPGLIPTIVS